ncbi:MAG: hypothetical protein P8Y47_11390 [Alphaproteobacteria bacterium]
MTDKITTGADASDIHVYVCEPRDGDVRLLATRGGCLWRSVLANPQNIPLSLRMSAHAMRLEAQWIMETAGALEDIANAVDRGDATYPDDWNY